MHINPRSSHYNIIYFNILFYFRFNIGLCKDIKTVCLSAIPDSDVCIHNLKTIVRCVEDTNLKNYINEYKNCTDKFDKMKCTYNLFEHLKAEKYKFNVSTICIDRKPIEDYIANESNYINLQIMLIVKSNISIDR